jgi:hypothetical protein
MTPVYKFSAHAEILSVVSAFKLIGWEGAHQVPDSGRFCMKGNETGGHGRCWCEVSNIPFFY